MKDVTKSDYRHKKRVCINFKIKHLGEYHDLYGQKNTFLLADIFEDFWNMCIGIFEYVYWNMCIGICVLEYNLILLIFSLHGNQPQ